MPELDNKPAIACSGGPGPTDEPPDADVSLDPGCSSEEFP